jgi:hypothetical protein
MRHFADVNPPSENPADNPNLKPGERKASNAGRLVPAGGFQPASNDKLAVAPGKAVKEAQPPVVAATKDGYEDRKKGHELHQTEKRLRNGCRGSH